MRHRLAAARTLHRWLPGYGAARWRDIRGRDRSTIQRVWVTIADHFEPWWNRADERTALERVQRWVRRWPVIAGRHGDSAGRPPCYTFFYPEEQYHPAALDGLARLAGMGIADVEVHLHHDADNEAAFVDRLGGFIERLHTRHALLRRDAGRIRFGFIHGDWALDNSLPGGHACGLDNEITLLRRLGCYADFTLPSAPSPAQTRIVNTIYWATDDPARPRSHDTGVPVIAHGGTAGDLLMIPGPLTLNLREWSQPLVPRLEVGELAGNSRPTCHRVALWKRVAPRIGEDLFIALRARRSGEKRRAAARRRRRPRPVAALPRRRLPDCGTTVVRGVGLADAERGGCAPARRASGTLRRRGTAASVRDGWRRVMTYSRLLESVLLPAYDRARGRRYVERRRFLERSQWWSADRLRAFQWIELKKLLTHAFASVPYLQHKYRSAGIAIRDLRSWDDFRRLPPLTRAEVNAHGPDLCSTAYEGRLLPHATGGSTGAPTRFFRTYESYDWRTAAKDRAYSWAGWRLGEPAIYLWGAPVGSVSRRQAWKARAYEAVQRQLIVNTFAQSDELWNEVYARALKFRPVLAVGYVSSLEAFAAYLRRTNRSIPGVRCAVAAAEPLFDATRRQIEGGLGVPLFNTYGSREFMSIAAECECRGGLHIHAENLVVETRDPDGARPSEILVTDLHNYGMPFIRYDSGDLGILADRACPCGRGLPMLETIEGRLLDALRTIDGRTVPGEFFPHLLKEIPELQQYRVEQKSLDRIVISAVVTGPLSDLSETLLRREIGKVFGSGTVYELQTVTHIPSLRSGKRRITVGMAPEPAGDARW
jgi:phenylacetate-CoA ligase